MAIKKTRASYVLLPGRQWLGRAGVALLVTSAAALLMMSKSGNPAAERIRTDITDIMTPVLAVASSPMDSLHEARTWFKEMSQLREENAALQYQNRQLLQGRLRPRKWKPKTARCAICSMSYRHRRVHISRRALFPMSAALTSIRR
jgi:hypothetical protein